MVSVKGNTRGDHQDIANQLFACYAHVQDVKSLTSVIGEDELSPLDKQYYHLVNYLNNIS